VPILTDHESHQIRVEVRMLRSISAVVLGVAAWLAVATVGNLALRQFLSGYAAVEAAMDFTLTMQIARLALGLASSLCAGVVAAAVSRSGNLAVRVVAVGMVLAVPAGSLRALG
jgi:hypothetical protein